MNCKIAFLGLGVIGTELLKQIKNNIEQIKIEYNLNIEFGPILVRNLNKKRNIDITNLKLTTNYNDIINDKNIDIVFECMGGVGSETTKYIVSNLISNGKKVIFSSKKCLATYGKEILKIARLNSTEIRFEAAVGGCIPIIGFLEKNMKTEKTKKLFGLINASSNYISSRMINDKFSYKESIKLAQDNGILENDVTEDIQGYDCLYKLILMYLVSESKWCSPSKFMLEKNISEIEKIDIDILTNLGYKIKQFGVFDNTNVACTDYYIGLALFNTKSIFYNIDNDNCIIGVSSTLSNNRYFIGKGAGAKPTASIMYDDFIDIINNKKMKLKDIQEYKCQMNYYSDFYLSFSNDDSSIIIIQLLEYYNLKYKILHKNEHKISLLVKNTNFQEMKSIINNTKIDCLYIPIIEEDI